MGTLVCFHAHPDDESIATGGTMAAAAAAGHRVVLVCATKGERGEVEDGYLSPGETLAERRVAETHASAAVLGVSVVEFLGYVDSGMMDAPENALEGSFWSCDVEEAAARLAEILRRESCDVLTVYDANGNYGHPDHIQVHRVGVRAAELAGVERVYESTVNRTRMQQRFREMAERGDLPDDAPLEGEIDLGVDESELTTCVDVRAWLETKRASMRAHASQITEASFFLAMPEESFAATFGEEWYIRHGAAVPVEEFETSII